MLIKSYILILVLLITFSCKQKEQEKNLVHKDYLSKWFIANENSLYNEFKNFVYTNSLCKTCDTTWGEMAYQQFDSATYMGRFSLEATKYCDSIEVTYFYNKEKDPKTRILLSTGYNKKLMPALDSIFCSVPYPKYFKVDKYEQPYLDLDGFGLPNLNIDNKDLRILMLQDSNLQNLKIFIYSKTPNVEISDDNKEFLKKELFGEELLLKKIKNIEFILTDTINTNLFTLKEVYSKLK